MINYIKNKKNIQTIKSLQISDQDLIIKEKGFKPFWTSSCQEKSDNLWLPVKTDLLESDLTCSNTSLKKPVEKSLYKKQTIRGVLQKKNLHKTFLVSSTSSPVEYMDSESTKKQLKKTCQHENCTEEINNKNLYFCLNHLPDKNSLLCQAPNKECKYKNKTLGFCGHHSVKKIKEVEEFKTHKIRIFPDTTQRKILNRWFGVSRKYYNETISYLNEGSVSSSFISTRPNVKNRIDETLEYIKIVPDKVRQGSIEDACKAVNNAKLKYKKENQFQKCRFRSKKANSQSLYIPSDGYNIRNDILSIFPTRLGTLKYNNKLINPRTDKPSRLVMKNNYSFYLHVLVPVKKYKTKQKNIIGLDPGHRTFMTGYSETEVVNYGDKNKIRLEHLSSLSHKLQSKIEKLKNERKCKTWKCKKLSYHFKMLKNKVSNIVDDLHKRTALDLCKNYKNIIIPPFETQKMSSKTNIKIGKVVRRNLNNLSHYKFRMFLIHKAKEYDSKIYVNDEAYTTKTCTSCGSLNTNVSQEKTTCKDCKNSICRDINGARNIFIKHTTMI